MKLKKQPKTFKNYYNNVLYCEEKGNEINKFFLLDYKRILKFIFIYYKNSKNIMLLDTPKQIINKKLKLKKKLTFYNSKRLKKQRFNNMIKQNDIIIIFLNEQSDPYLFDLIKTLGSVKHPVLVINQNFKEQINNSKNLNLNKFDNNTQISYIRMITSLLAKY